MSLAGICSSSLSSLSTGSLRDQFQQQAQQIGKDFQQLGQDLKSGNLSAAQSDFATLQKDAPQLNSTSSTASTNPLAQLINQLSTDLSSGNLPAAQQDLSTIQQDFQNSQGGAQVHHHHHHHSGDNAIQQVVDQLGQALQSGNLSSAQQAYAALQQDFQQFAPSGVIASQTNSAVPAGNVSVQA